MSNVWKSKRFIGFSILAAFILAIMGFLFWVWGLNLVHWVTTAQREATPFWFWLPIILIGFGWAIHVHTKNSQLSYSTPSSKAYWFGYAAAFIGIIAMCWMVTVADYTRLSSYYAKGVEVAQDSEAQSYANRAPFEVASATSNANMQNVNGTATAVKSLPDDADHGVWNVLVVARGLWVGYETLQTMNLPLYGTPANSDVSFCAFNPNMQLRHGGALPHNNLSRAIYGQVPLNVDWDTRDVYGYCDPNGDPIVVTPLKQIDGFFFPTWRYYGVALLNGNTGDIIILTDVDEINQIPGPVYPLSLASTQRVSTSATGGFWDYYFGSQGYETATADNSEVNLRNAENDESYFVTTMNPRGESTSIVAVTETAASVVELNGNQLNPLKLNILPQERIRSANSTLENDIRTAYSYMPEFTNSEASLILEITSGENGNWVASIGRIQSVNYRAYITVNGSETTIELVDARGNIIAQNGSAGTEDVQDGDTTLIPVPGADLSGLTVEELKAINDAVVAELAARASN